MELSLDKATWDLHLDATGNIATVGEADFPALLSQRITHRLQTFKGECFLDREIGVPYYEEILKKNPDLGRIRSLLSSVISGIDGVDLTKYNETDSTFKDVKVGAWFHNAITWAVEKGYVAGMSPDSFKPNDNLTREQLVRILYNYAKDNVVDVTGRADLTVFEDYYKISSWAYEEMSWAVHNKIVSGMTATTVGPKGTATRAQAMQIIKQFDAMAAN